MCISNARQEIDRVIYAFFDACQFVKCIERRTPICSSNGFDPSVRFIGSHISVLLPFMLNKRVPPNGIAMWQDCIRMRSLHAMLQTGHLKSPWGSYFIALGTVLPETHEQQASVLLRRCLEDGLKIKPSCIEVSYLPTDHRIANMATRHLGRWRQREDTNPCPYRHKVGVDTVLGKNLNVAISTNGTDFDLIANIIIYENNGMPCGIEVALGTSTVVKVLRNLNHVIDAFPFSNLDVDVPVEAIRCWKDAAVTSLQLLREGLQISGQHNRHRLLRKYLSIFRFSEVTSKLGKNKLQDILHSYLLNYYTSDFVLVLRPMNKDLRAFLPIRLIEPLTRQGGRHEKVHRRIDNRRAFPTQRNSRRGSHGGSQAASCANVA